VHPVIRFLIVAFLIWLIPFLVSLPFFNRDGQLQTNFWLFKGVMGLVLSSSSFILFRWLAWRWSPRPRPVTMALLGLAAAAISVALDAVTVIPLAQMGLSDYIVQIVSLYLLIIGMSVAAGMHQNEREDTRAIA
jgi:glucan phosphoethanolaminetransferase (alkaline phosphatase superfamily)